MAQYIKSLFKAAQRVKRAVKKKERIILYGDGDLDGITSVVILQEAIKNIGGSVSAVYFPDREEEGYGITQVALRKLKPLAPALFVAMDLGITNFKEIKIANAMRFEVILVDHHEIIDGLPDAGIIVNPKQKGDRYPFKFFAACGLTFRLAEELLGKDVSKNVRKGLLELAMLGTVADMMAREQDNKMIIEEGMAEITSTWRPGLRAFFRSRALSKRESLGDKVGYMISVLNVRDIEHELPGAYRLLTSTSIEEAQVLLKTLEEKNEIRHKVTDEIAEKTEKAFSQHPDLPLIFHGDPVFEYVLLGGAASILAKKFSKPVFLYKEKGQECLGSVRAPHGYDTVKAMKSCKELLLAFGGHPPASGFRLKTKNIKKFQDCLIRYFLMG